MLPHACNVWWNDSLGAFKKATELACATEPSDVVHSATERGMTSRRVPSGADYRPREWFREPLLNAFEALGPNVDTDEVRKWLARYLKPMLSDGDFEMVNRGRT
jgi:hypothetical protein